MTQWTLNIGGIPNDRNSPGLQIPIHVIIAGILGAYICYLYIGISEFKVSFQQKLNSFEESYHTFLNALDDYNAHTRKTISPWPPVFEFQGILPRMKRYAREFADEVSHLEDDAPSDIRNSGYTIPNPELFTRWVPNSPEPPFMSGQFVQANAAGRGAYPLTASTPQAAAAPQNPTVVVNRKEKRRFLWSRIREAETNFKNNAP